MKTSTAKDQYWSDYYKQGADFVAITSQEVRLLLTYVQKTAPKTALDIGCGTGHLTRELCRNNYRVVGLDVSKVAIRIAKSLSTAPTTSLYYSCRDIETEGLTDLPFIPYDLIIFRYVYAFIVDIGKLLHIIQEVLTPDGTLVIISPQGEKIPKHKKDIAVDPERTLAELRKHFKVKYHQWQDDEVFICRHR